MELYASQLSSHQYQQESTDERVNKLREGDDALEQFKEFHEKTKLIVYDLMIQYHGPAMGKFVFCLVSRSSLLQLLPAVETNEHINNLSLSAMNYPCRTGAIDKEYCLFIATIPVSFYVGHIIESFDLFINSETTLDASQGINIVLFSFILLTRLCNNGLRLNKFLIHRLIITGCFIASKAMYQKANSESILINFWEGVEGGTGILLTEQMYLSCLTQDQRIVTKEDIIELKVSILSDVCSISESKQ